MATEKRLIEANALQSRICGAKCGCEYEDCGCEGDCQFDFFISNATTVDAVEVVRCEKCKKYHYPFCLLNDTSPNGWLTNRKPDDFCSYGERRTE